MVSTWQVRIGQTYKFIGFISEKWLKYWQWQDYNGDDRGHRQMNKKW